MADKAPVAIEAVQRIAEIYAVEAKLRGQPHAYLRDVLQRMIDGHPINRLDDLLPWAWKPQNHVKS